MMKIVAQFEYEVNGKVGRIIMDHDTSIVAAKEMVFAFLKHLGNLEDQAKAQAEENEKTERENQEVEPTSV